MENEAYMREALALARRGWGRTHPNPMVGALLVEAGQVVAKGWHRAAGQEHAEVACLRALGRRPQAGATLYVTLEPCSTQGRTPPCTQAIVQSGVRRVVVGCQDPNPLHAGRGLELLRQAGVEVVQDVLREDCEDLNMIFNHAIIHKRPFIAAKWAASVDGYVATRTGGSKWITGEAARTDVMQWRRLFPAIVTGVGTVLADNPALTARVAGESAWCPRRFVIDSSLRILRHAQPLQVLEDAYVGQTCLVTTQPVPDSLPCGVTVWTLPADSQGRVDLRAFVERCAQEGLAGLFLEGGPTLNSAFLQATGWDYVFAYQAPCLFADPQARPVAWGLSPAKPSEALRLEEPRWAPLGEDLLLRGHVKTAHGLSG